MQHFSVVCTVVQRQSGAVGSGNLAQHNPPSSGQSIVEVQAVMSMTCMAKVMGWWQDDITRCHIHMSLWHLWQGIKSCNVWHHMSLACTCIDDAKIISSSWDICFSSCCSVSSVLTDSCQWPQVITTSPPPPPMECTRHTYSHPQDSFSLRGMVYSYFVSEGFIIVKPESKSPMEN